MALCFAVLSCGRGQPPANGAAPDVAADTARGILQVVGAEPLTSLLLSPLSGTSGTGFMLRGPDSTRLRSLAGLDVTVIGTRAGDAVGESPRPTPVFVVTRFVVRSVEGVPTHDGVIAVEGGRFLLVAADGTRLEVPHLPPSLRHRSGTRVYLAGSLGAPPVAYGIIADR